MTSGFIGMPLWTIPPEPLQPMTSGFIEMPLCSIPPEPLQPMTSGFIELPLCSIPCRLRVRIARTAAAHDIRFDRNAAVHQPT